MHKPKSEEDSSRKKVHGVFEKVPGSGVWWIRFADRPYHIRREKAGTRSNAKKLYSLRTAAVLKAEKLPPTGRQARLRFSELAGASLQFSLGRAGHRNDEHQMKKLNEHFGNYVAEDITPEDIENWLRSKTSWSDATKNRYLALIKRTFRLAEKNRKIKVNPARLVRMTKENNERTRYLDEYPPLPTTKAYLKRHTTEEARLRAVIQKHFPLRMPELDIAIHCGLRKSEQYGLHWTNINFERRLLTVLKSKHGRSRHVPLNAVAVSAFRQLLRRGKSPDGYIFRTERRYGPRHQKQVVRVKNTRHWFEWAVQEAGIREVPDERGKLRPFTWHTLRHTFGSRLIMAGVDVRTVQELMGHKSIQVTMRYTHLAKPHLQAGVDKLAQLSTAKTTESSEVWDNGLAMKMGNKLPVVTPGVTPTEARPA